MTRPNNVVKEVFSDLQSCKNRAIWLYENLPVNRKFIAAGLVILFILILVFSSNQTFFYIKLISVLLAMFVTFIMYVIADTFWFLAIKIIYYRINLDNTRKFRYILRKHPPRSRKPLKNPQQRILNIVKRNTKDYYYHASRYVIEFILLLILIINFYPSLVFFILILASFMFFYHIFYDKTALYQAHLDMIDLVKTLYRYHLQDEEKCKQFIMENSNTNIQKLSKIYKTISRK